jgi:hypothetical protein
MTRHKIALAGVQLFSFVIFRDQAVSFAPIPSRVGAHGTLKHRTEMLLFNGADAFIVSKAYRNTTQ